MIPWDTFTSNGMIESEERNRKYRSVYWNSSNVSIFKKIEYFTGASS